MISRRAFLKSLAKTGVAWFLPWRAAASQANLFTILRATLPGEGVLRPNAPLVLLRYVVDRTSVQVSFQVPQAPLGSLEMFRSPFALVVGQDDYGGLDRGGIEGLRRYLDSGGFLVVDCAGTGSGYHAFLHRVMEDMRRAFGPRPFRKIPPNHVLYRAFYKVKSVAGRLDRVGYMEGIELGGRFAVVLSHNDLTGAWAQDSFGNWLYTPVPGGASQRTEALHLGTNLVMYSLLLDYKDQQPHVRYLLRERRLPSDLETQGQKRMDRTE